MAIAKLRCAFVILGAIAAGAGALQAAETARVERDMRREASVLGDAQAGAAKATVCAACHGQQGVAIVPGFPSLAGQSATYLYVELRAYQDGSRPNPVMAPLVESLSDEDMKDLAAYYASLRASRPPAATSTGNTDAGHALYARGDAERGVPPCQGCHGEAGRGPAAAPARTAFAPPTAWHTFPTLAGLQAPYVVAQLKAYKDGSRADSTNDRIMHGVVQNLDDAAMEALAAYVEQLAPE